jgi:hypothetical protein
MLCSAAARSCGPLISPRRQRKTALARALRASPLLRQHLNLFQIAAGPSAQLGAGPAEIVGRAPPQTDFAGIAGDDPPDGAFIH